MPGSGPERFHKFLQTWREKTKQSLRRRWYLFLLLLLLDGLRETLRHRFYSEINRWFDFHAGAMASIAMRLLTEPVVLSLLLSVLVILSLVIRAYFATRTAAAAEQEHGPPVSPLAATPTMEEMRERVAAADAQAKEEEELEQQRQRAIEHPEVERFREVYLQVTTPVVYTTENVVSGLLLARAHVNPGYLFMYNLLDNYVVPPCRSAKYRLDLDMRVEAVAPLETIISDLQFLLSKYATLIGCIDQAARAILSPQEYYGSEWYSGLHQRHKDCLRELNKISQRAKFESLRPSLASLYDLLTAPPLSAGPPSPIPSGSGQPPSPESS